MRVASAVAVASAALLLITGCQAPPTADLTEQDRATLTALFDSTVTTIRAKNWAGWAAQFTDETRFQPPNGPAVIGRPAIQSWAEGFPPVEAFAFQNVQVQGKGNIAWGTSDFTMTLTGLPPDTGKQLVVFERDANGVWHTIAVSFNSDIPLPPPAAPAAK